jgi:hypothetical protein
MGNGLAKLRSIPTYASITGVAVKATGEKHSSITQYWQFYSSVWSSLAHHFAGEVEWEKGSYGKAISLQEKSYILCKQSLVGGPFVGELAIIHSEAQSWMKNEETLLIRYKGENSTIYYDPVPPYDSLDDLPSATIMKLVPFVEHEAIPFSLSTAVQDTPASEPPPPPAYSDVVSPRAGELEIHNTPLSSAQRRLEGMGFDKANVTEALFKFNQNEQAAVEYLLSKT